MENGAGLRDTITYRHLALDEHFMLKPAKANSTTEDTGHGGKQKKREKIRQGFLSGFLCVRRVLHGKNAVWSSVVTSSAWSPRTT
jgi:hypothetical protein